MARYPSAMNAPAWTDTPVAASRTEPGVGLEQNTDIVVATRYEIDKLAALCALLTEQPAVFPAAVGQAVRPLALGILEALKPLLRAEAGIEQLRAALRVYTLSLAYLLAQSRPGAWRHDLAGVPVAPVSEEHRSSARQRFIAARAHRDRVRKERRAGAAVTSARTIGSKA